MNAPRSSTPAEAPSRSPRRRPTGTVSHTHTRPAFPLSPHRRFAGTHVLHRHLQVYPKPPATAPHGSPPDSHAGLPISSHRLPAQTLTDALDSVPRLPVPRAGPALSPPAPLTGQGHTRCPPTPRTWAASHPGPVHTHARSRVHTRTQPGRPSVSAPSQRCGVIRTDRLSARPRSPRRDPLSDAWTWKLTGPTNADETQAPHLHFCHLSLQALSRLSS